MTTRIIAMSNIKGGVGKTTTTINLAAGLARLGRSVLVVDTDPQSNATFGLSGLELPTHSLYDVLIADVSGLSHVIVQSKIRGVDFVPSSIELSAADLALAAVPGRERMLARLLRDVDGYDFVFIDTPPSLGLLTVNGLTAAEEVFVPISTGVFSLLGVPLLEDAISQIHENFEMRTPVISGAIITLYDRTRVANDTVQAIRQHFGDRCYDTFIPKYKDIQESQSRSMSIYDYAPNSSAALAFQALTEEVLLRLVLQW